MSFVATWIVILSKGRQIEKNKYSYVVYISKMKRQSSEWEKIIANEATDKELI